MQGSPRPHPTLLVSSNTKWTYAVTVDMPIVGISEGPGVNIAYSGSHLRTRNARQSEAASDSASVFKHEVDIYGHGGNAHHRYLGGPGGEYCLFEVPFCEYAMRGSPRPHPALLVSSNMKLTHTVTADKTIVGISEGPGVNIVFSRSHFANTQCEAARSRIPLC